MLHIIKKIYYLIFIGLFFSYTLHAEDNDWYQIEVVFFENQANDANLEMTSVQSSHPNFNNAIELYYQDSDETLTEFYILDLDELQLKNVISRLDQSAQYRLIDSIGWRQQLTQSSKSQAIRLIGGINYQPTEMEPIDEAIPSLNQEQLPLKPDNDGQWEIDGVINLKLGRYIEVDMNILVRKHLLSTLSSIAELNSQLELEPKLLKELHIQHVRRMRSNETYYLDHPKYGILIQISKIEGIPFQA